MKPKKHQCPNCSSDEFITLPNRYDIMTFEGEAFEISRSEFIDDKDSLFCRECGEEIDQVASSMKKKVVLKKSA
jgi:hypothetical protein